MKTMGHMMAHRSHNKRRTKMKIKCLIWFSVLFLFHYITFYLYFTFLSFDLFYFHFISSLFYFSHISFNFFLFCFYCCVIFTLFHLDFWQILCILMWFSYENAGPLELITFIYFSQDSFKVNFKFIQPVFWWSVYRANYDILRFPFIISINRFSVPSVSSSKTRSFLSVNFKSSLEKYRFHLLFYFA